MKDGIQENQKTTQFHSVDKFQGNKKLNMEWLFASLVVYLSLYKIVYKPRLRHSQLE